MKYYILNFKIEKGSYFAENGKISNEELSEIYSDGVQLKNQNISITLYKNKGKLLNVVENLFSIPIISEKIKRIIEENSNNNEVEFYPIKVNMETDSNYYFINVLNNVEAMDYEESEYLELMPKSRIFEKISKLCLLENKLNERNIFRLVNHELDIFISELIKEKLEKLNLPELEFIPVEDFTWELGQVDW